jgi:glycosyltransferase involved in cell wall biosynthesis
METRRGKGAALQAGFQAARGEVIVRLDADGSMAPEEAVHFVSALMAGADLVKGSRTIQGAGSVDISWFRSLGNRGLTLIDIRTIDRVTLSQVNSQQSKIRVDRARKSKYGS